MLRTVDDLQARHEISIIKLSEPISSAIAEASSNGGVNTARTSDASISSLDNLTPASLEADLEHYRELFAKLRFSYVEQVTKEKFIRAIVGDLAVDRHAAGKRGPRGRECGCQSSAQGAEDRSCRHGG